MPYNIALSFKDIVYGFLSFSSNIHSFHKNTKVSMGKMELLVLTSIKSQAVRYVFVGLANTALTAAVIFSLMQFGVGIYLSNVSGYVAGILFSFIMNVRFTFSTSLSFIKFIKFLSVCAICYIFNLVAMKFFLTLMPQHVYTAQFIGMFFYTAIGFILNKFWSMK
ncbi:GtrA family protein [Klebsiella quasivariicola]|uniref:GtrA family protein n=1 Tax=Klebsiella quasivariicola TaxID=2026240 RepID=UPI00315DCE0C